MQTPSMKTPVAKCLDLSLYLIVMLGRFPQNPRIAALLSKAQGAADKLESAQQTYVGALKDVISARALVKFENFMSDRRISQAQKRADIAGPPVRDHLFPEGSAAITRLVGQSQIDAMVLLEGRLASIASTWPEAADEQAAIAQHRDAYEAAVKARTAAGQKSAALRAVREVARRAFLATYEEIQGEIIAAFPRDSTMQELFFDDVRTRSSAAEAEDTGGDAESASAPAPAASPAP